MASYNTINAYDATCRIPLFRGLLQYGDCINTDPRYSPDACNVSTPAGVLQPVAACTVSPDTLPAPIETLAMLPRRWYRGTPVTTSGVLGYCKLGQMHLGDETRDVVEADKNVLIASSGGALYAMVRGIGWQKLAYPDGFTAYKSSRWSCAVYEINPDGFSAPVDVLLMSNELDGMVMVRGDTLHVSVVKTPKKFGIIERYAERIWGGAITDDPDMLVYSAPYDPTNWTADVEIPEDGAGDIMQPSFDGDRFTALKAFGSQMIAFKKTRVWRVLGTDPGEFTFREQYGGGAPYAATIAVDTERIFALTSQGVVCYDGTAVAPFSQEYAQDVFRRLNADAIDGACACIWRKNYYCAIPLDDSTINNAVLVYNTADNTWLLRDDVSVEAFLPTEDALYFTSATTPGQFWTWHDDAWREGVATTGLVRWTTPWNDLNYKNIQKGGFEVYLTAEVQEDPVVLEISVQTEKKTKTKSLLVTPLTDNKKSYKQKRLHFGGAGRRFRLIVEARGQAPWRLIGGLMVQAEIDTD